VVFAISQFGNTFPKQEEVGLVECCLTLIIKWLNQIFKWHVAGFKLVDDNEKKLDHA